MKTLLLGALVTYWMVVLMVLRFDSRREVDIYDMVGIGIVLTFMTGLIFMIGVLKGWL